MDITLNNEKLEQVSEFVYLGSQISEDGKYDQDIKRRSSLASAIVGKLGRIWRSCNILTKTKIKVYESLVNRHTSISLWITMLEPEETRRKQYPFDRNGLAQKNTGSL